MDEHKFTRIRITSGCRILPLTKSEAIGPLSDWARLESGHLVVIFSVSVARISEPVYRC